MQNMPTTSANKRATKLTSKDVKHLFEVCQGLKGLAGELACERISDQELAALSKMHIARAQHYHDRDLQLYYLCKR